MQDKIRELLLQRAEGTIAEPSRMTVGENLDKCMKDAASLRVRPSTDSGYSDLIRLHIKPSIGGMLLTIKGKI